jgi:hypothetical protein
MNAVVNALYDECFQHTGGNQAVALPTLAAVMGSGHRDTASLGKPRHRLAARGCDVPNPAEVGD